MINYSIIIPHKNTPDLLQKCLDSIPRRKDVQIIVVDDNSDEDKVDFANFPSLYDETVEVYLTKEGSGAGYARNFGLEQATGKWIVFADSDDFFLPDVNTAMDEFIDKDYDVVYFKGTAIYLKDGSPSRRTEYLSKAVDDALNGDFTAAFESTSPCQKFVKRTFLINNGIKFNEVKWGDDIVWGVRVAYYAETYSASPLQIYCVTESDNSSIKAKCLESYIVRFNEECQLMDILRRKFVISDFQHSWFVVIWLLIYKKNKWAAIIRIPQGIKHDGWRFIQECYRAKFKKQ